jgi:polysaccharide pyruvyl transferase WcaK-like protein
MDDRFDTRLAELPFPNIDQGSEVVIIGNYGSGNLGDEMMLDALVELISIKVGRTTVIVPSRRPDIVNKMHPKIMLSSIGVIRGMLRALLSDVLIIGAGTVFSSHSGPGIKAGVIIAILRKILLRKKVFFYGIGYSATTSKILKMLSKPALNLADGIYVRDTLSYSRLKSIINNNERIFVIPELGLFLRKSPFLPEELRGIVKKGKGPLVGFSLMHPGSYAADYMNNVSDAVKGFIQYLHIRYSDAKFLFLTFQPTIIRYSPDWISDEEVGLMITSRLPEEIRSNCYVLKRYPPMDTLRIISETDLIISMRYHCLVFASTQNKPYIAISFDDKHRAFVKDDGGEIIDISQVSATSLIQLWEKIWKD